MKRLSLENLSSVSEIRKTLLTVRTDYPDYDFSWLMPIIESTLEEKVIVHLNFNEPKINRFVSLDLQAHISEATALINKSIAKRNEIYDLEAGALYKAIDYIQAITSNTEEQTLALLGLKAMFNQSQEGDYEIYEKALKLKFEKSDNSLQTKFSLHNQPGNPLNYGERTKYLREIYCDNVRIIYERFFAIKRTLWYSFKQEAPPIPDYLEISSNLDQLVIWMRGVVGEYETKSQYEIIVTKSISLSKSMAYNDTDSDENWSNLRNGLVPIIPIIGNRDLLNIKDWEKKSRILGLSVNIIGWFDLTSEKEPVYYGEQPQDAQYLVDHPEGAIHLNNINNNILNTRSLQYSKRANNETKRNNILYSYELSTEAIVDLPQPIDFYFKKNDEEALDNDLFRGVNIKRLVSVLGYDTSGFEVDGNGDPIIRLTPTENVNDFIYPDYAISGETRAVQDPVNSNNLNFIANSALKNCSPYHHWKLKLDNVSCDKDMRAENLLGVKDIVITYRIAIR